MITTRDVLELTGLPEPTFTEWLVKRIASPTKNEGPGKGRGYRFSEMLAVGIAVAVELRNGERGCALGYIAQVIQAFGKQSPEWLEKQFKDGRTHFALVVQGKPVLDGKRYDEWPDVKAIYERVKALDNK